MNAARLLVVMVAILFFVYTGYYKDRATAMYVPDSLVSKVVVIDSIPDRPAIKFYLVYRDKDSVYVQIDGKVIGATPNHSPNTDSIILNHE